jgi:YidC/Oxa1 family membrane protein insertase
MFSAIYTAILYQPILNIFVLLYNYLGHDVGVVILLITILVRLALYPLTSSSIKAQKSLQELQPKLEELKKKHAKDQQGLAQATMELYKTNKVNPFASCLPLLIQLPILIALYSVLRDGLASNNIAAHLYSFVHDPGKINPVTFGIFDLSHPNYILAVLAGVAQFLQARTMMRKSAPKVAAEGSKDENMMAMMNKQMLYVMPVMTIIIGIKLPAGLTLYWVFTTLLMLLQQWLVNKKMKSTSAPSSIPTIPSEQKKVIEGEIVDKTSKP